MKGENLKRSAHEEIARAYMMNDDQQPPKKPRFDSRNPSTLATNEAGDEDTILELDEIGKGGLQSKRKAVRLEGYESDSSSENFDARAEAKADQVRKDKRKPDKSNDEEANDMFADLEEDFEDADEDEDLAQEGKKKKKEVRFMNEAEIVGQVSNSKTGGHVSADFSFNGARNKHNREVESSSEESVDEEERDQTGEDVDEELGAGSKKKHAPKLDAFNMRNETEEGRFDESGNFVRNAVDPYAVYDSWMEGSSKADMKRAKEAKEKRDEDRRKKDIANDALSGAELLAILIRELDGEETVLEALARLGSSKPKQKPRWKNQKREMDVDARDAADSGETARKEAIEVITGAADQLFTRGQTEIYEAERALLVRQYRRETGDEWVDDARKPAEERQWEYRWSDNRDEGATHGPYDGSTMTAWDEAGYFGEGVEFREVNNTGWSKSVDFV